MLTELIPVIHKLSTQQVFTNVELCHKLGIKKVFLIDHSAFDQKHTALIQDAIKIKEKYPIWVGLNLLGLSAQNAISQDLPVDGLWCDQTISLEIAQNRTFKGLLFGGLAFKYQKQPTDLQSACLDAQLTTDVATTSGPGTGQEAAFEKIQLLRNYLGNHPLAIASGVSKKNITLYKGIVNYLLVATSITDAGELINENKLKELFNLL